MMEDILKNNMTTTFFLLVTLILPGSMKCLTIQNDWELN